MQHIINHYQSLNQTPSGKVNIEGLTKLKSAFNKTSILFFTIAFLVFIVNAIALCTALFAQAPIEAIIILIVYMFLLTFGITISIIIGIITRAISKGLILGISPYIPVYKPKKAKYDSERSQEVIDDFFSNTNNSSEVKILTCECGKIIDEETNFCSICGKKQF